MRPSVSDSALTAKVGRRLTPDDLASQLERLEASWGAPKDRTDAQMVAMTREWFSQLDRFGVRSVEAAFTHVIGTHKFQWAGAIVEIVSYCTKDDGDWRDALGMRAEPRHVAEPVAFASEGRTEAEEIAHRVAMIASMKRQAGFNSAPDVDGDTAAHEPIAASKSAIVTPQVRNSCAARRARREKTCEPSCFRQSCALREHEAAQGGVAIDSQSPLTGSSDFSDTGPRPESEAARNRL